jgi:hypothetical protein
MAGGARCFNARAGKLDQALVYATRAREAGDLLGDAQLLAEGPPAACAGVCRPRISRQIGLSVGRWTEGGLPDRPRRSHPDEP